MAALSSLTAQAAPTLIFSSATEGLFTWSNGDALTYTHWAAGEPNNWSNIEDYGSMNWLNGSNAWNDLPDGGYGAGALTPIFGVIEVSRVPEPGALGLVGVALAAAAAVRRRRSARHAG